MIAESEFAAWLLRQAGNHLWQSTAFAAIAFLVAVALRATHARTRHWVWLAASVKFLVPFGVLASLGGVIGSWVAPAAPVARIPFTVEQAVQPFALPPEAVPVVAAPAPGSAAFPAAAVVLAVWLIGFAAVLFHWWNRWRNVRAVVRASAPVREGREADALRRLRPDVVLVSSGARLEPGTFGILRPVLWLPAGIAKRLSETELDAILAHELCHLRRRDNLWAAVHMVVEAIFWFHPLVWWLGARLVEERERACDEEVVRLGSEPQAYAEGVLKVCEFYLESPLTCAAGVTGGELRRRIESIMESRFINELGFWKKSLLAALLAAVVACPLVLGAFKAQAMNAEVPSIRLAGQQSPHPRFEVASVRPSSFDIQREGEKALRYGTTVRVGQHVRGDRVEYTFVGPWTLICDAYRIKGNQVVGLNVPKGVRFDIVAKIPADGRKEDVYLMLQDLLAERFKLAVHQETKEQNVLALVVRKGGPKLKATSPEDLARTDQLPEGTQFPPVGSGPSVTTTRKGSTAIRQVIIDADVFNPRMRVEAQGITMADLADLLAKYQGGDRRLVMNATGLVGRFDIALDLHFSDMQPLTPSGTAAGTASSNPADAVSEPGGTSLTQCLRKLGLELVSRKMPVNVLVVDHIEQTPTEN